MSDAHDSDDADAAARVSARLKEAFDAVARADIDVPDKGRWQRRLIAVTNTAKHDVVRAEEQLVRYLEEWNWFRRGKEDAR